MKGRKIRREKKEDETKTCPICIKSFNNGKALGGHLRAHFAKHPFTPDSDSLLEPGPIRVRIAPVLPPNQSRALRNRRRSDRVGCAAANSVQPTKTHDSVGLETFSEEDGAMCLMMLPRDSWTRKSGTPPQVRMLRREELYESVKNDVVEGNDMLGHKTTVELEPGEYVGYECGFCNKVFESEAEHKKLHVSNCRVMRTNKIFS